MKLRPALLLVVLGVCSARAAAPARLRPSLASAQEPPAIGAAGPALEQEQLHVAARRPQGADSLAARQDAERRVDLGSLFNRQWTGAHSAAAGGTTLHLSVTFDLNGQAYVSVKADEWASPLFFKLERGLSGDWELGGARYRVGLDVNIFRSRLSNFIVVWRDGQARPVYKRRIRELLSAAYETGETVIIGGRSYKLFFSYNVDGYRKPPRLDEGRFGVVFVHDADPRGEHDFDPFIVPYAELAAGGLRRYPLYDGQPVGLRLLEDKTTLELYDLR